jgi:hypothetical protein
MIAQSGIVFTWPDHHERPGLLTAAFCRAARALARGASRSWRDLARFFGDAISTMRQGWVSLCSRGRSWPWSRLLPGGHGQPRKDRSGLRTQESQGTGRTLDCQLHQGTAAIGGDLVFQSRASARGSTIRGGLSCRSPRPIRVRFPRRSRDKRRRLLPGSSGSYIVQSSKAYSARCFWPPSESQECSDE